MSFAAREAAVSEAQREFEEGSPKAPRVWQLVQGDPSRDVLDGRTVQSQEAAGRGGGRWPFGGAGRGHSRRRGRPGVARAGLGVGVRGAGAFGKVSAGTKDRPEKSFLVNI